MIVGVVRPGAKGNLPLLAPEEVDEHLGVVELTLKHITGASCRAFRGPTHVVRVGCTLVWRADGT
eukprot:3090689-Rhodomonas_salina.1